MVPSRSYSYPQRGLQDHTRHRPAEASCAYPRDLVLNDLVYAPAGQNISLASEDTNAPRPFFPQSTLSGRNDDPEDAVERPDHEETSHSDGLGPSEIPGPVCASPRRAIDSSSSVAQNLGAQASYLHQGMAPSQPVWQQEQAPSCHQYFREAALQGSSIPSPDYRQIAQWMAPPPAALPPSPPPPYSEASPEASLTPNTHQLQPPPSPPPPGHLAYILASFPADPTLAPELHRTDAEPPPLINTLLAPAVNDPSCGSSLSPLAWRAQMTPETLLATFRRRPLAMDQALELLRSGAAVVVGREGATSGGGFRVMDDAHVARLQMMAAGVLDGVDGMYDLLVDGDPFRRARDAAVEAAAATAPRGMRRKRRSSNRNQWQQMRRMIVYECYESGGGDSGR